MNLLVLGGDGMLGHRLVKHFRGAHRVVSTVRGPLKDYKRFGLFSKENCFDGIEVTDFDAVKRVISECRPDAVINCVGIVKQRKSAKDHVASLEVNSLFPHRLAGYCMEQGIRVIHFSTDCVFSGGKGMYTEADLPDARDLYGRSKLMGELADYPNCFTIRSSIIGYELSRYSGLLEWFLAQKGTVNGFTNAIYSGFTTDEMSRVVEMLLAKYPRASGCYHVSSEPISKYDLLVLVRDVAGLDIEIRRFDDFHCDRSLESSKFRGELCYSPPDWKTMITDMIRQGREGTCG